ncbi:MAG: hypothetical protein HYX79_00055 [Chloroflexi bacterium]|nr:hypothetical protein [Chloroflexota bacterium]
MDQTWAAVDQFENFASVFNVVLVVIVVLAGIGLAIDIERLAIKHNREIRQKQERSAFLIEWY